MGFIFREPPRLYHGKELLTLETFLPKGLCVLFVKGLDFGAALGLNIPPSSASVPTLYLIYYHSPLWLNLNTTAHCHPHFTTLLKPGVVQVPVLD